MGKSINNHFINNYSQMTDKHMERSSTSLVIREMQIKLTMKYHYALIKMAKMKMMTNLRADEIMEMLDSAYICW